jgi:hypothetical protein
MLRVAVVTNDNQFPMLVNSIGGKLHQITKEKEQDICKANNGIVKKTFQFQFGLKKH